VYQYPFSISSGHRGNTPATNTICSALPNHLLFAPFGRTSITGHHGQDEHRHPLRAGEREGKGALLASPPGTAELEQQQHAVVMRKVTGEGEGNDTGEASGKVRLMELRADTGVVLEALFLIACS